MDCFVSAMNSQPRQLLANDRCSVHVGEASLLTSGNWPRDCSSFHVLIFSDIFAAGPLLCR